MYLLQLIEHNKLRSKFTQKGNYNNPQVIRNFSKGKTESAKLLFWMYLYARTSVKM